MNALEGVLAAALTARRASGYQLDIGPTFEVIDFLGSKGIKGIALFGATGEFPHFDFEERTRLVTMAVRRSRVPVLVNVSHSTFDAAVLYAQQATQAGAAGLLLMPPYFYRYSQADVREFYLRFVADAGRIAPVYLYNLPCFTSPISAATATELLLTGRFAGIKDSSGEPEMLGALTSALEQAPFRYFIGNDRQFAQGRKQGAHGVISGCACAVPELLVAIDRAITNGNQEKLRVLEGHLDQFIGWVERFPTPMLIRAALRRRKIACGHHAVPLSPDAQESIRQFEIWFDEWLPTMIADSKS
jgi:4-hydroxy-tetrahydrodipicolinate synthase